MLGLASEPEMRRSRFPRLALMLLIGPMLMGNLDPTPIPAPVRAMMDAAFANDDEAAVSTIVRYAKATNPEAAGAITAMADAWRADRQAHKLAVIERAGLFDLWSGKAELGGYFSTGNTQTKGLTGVLDLTREGLQWRHKFHAQADFQSSRGVTSREHYLASYEPNYKFDDDRYIYGAAQYESDKFLGYTDRLSFSVGAGYNVVKNDRVTLDLELGPAFRNTYFTNGLTQASLASRGSLAFNWRVTPAISLKQDASAYLQRFNSTVSGTTALNAKLIGPLSAQLSYQVQYESEPPAGRLDVDTTGRAALVYSF